MSDRPISRVIYDTPNSRNDIRKTFACFGNPRGGTSMVAGLMHGLGVNMGENLPVNYEDEDFVNKPGKHIRQAIADRNQGQDIWGWKHPNAVNYIDDMMNQLRNLRVVLVFRDPAVIAINHERFHKRTPQRALNEIMLQYLKNMSFVDRTRRPTMIVSYEKAIANPERFISDLSEFLCVTPPDDLSELITFMKPGSYKKLGG